MHGKFLGDSFDIVKRFCAERLGSIAPLYAHPRFVPHEIRESFEAMVAMQVFDLARSPIGPFGLFLDPHTGIPLPNALSQKVTSAHAPLSFIAAELERLKPTYMICFDQSHDRNAGLKSSEQRTAKRDVLQGKNIFSFYYVSHAPFLFAASDATVLEAVRGRLVDSGIPRSRFES